MISSTYLLLLCVLPAVLCAEPALDFPAYAGITPNLSTYLNASTVKDGTTFMFGFDYSGEGSYGDGALAILRGGILTLSSGDFATAACIRNGKIAVAPNSDPSSDETSASANVDVRLGDMAVLLMPHNGDNSQLRSQWCLRSLAAVKNRGGPNVTAKEVLQMTLLLNSNWCAGFFMAAATIRDAPGRLTSKPEQATFETHNLLQAIEADLQATQ